MPLSLKHVRFTTRRSGDTVQVYPRLLRDRSILPKIDIAIQHFETMLGRERRDFESEVLVHFLGDHKLARSIVACLARAYRFRPRGFEEIVTRTAFRRLERLGVDNPKALRLALFDRVNDFGHGYLDLYERDRTVCDFEAELGMRAGELDRLLWLDADEHARLVRVGGEPKATDVVAQYNFGVLEAVLRHAESVELTCRPAGAASAAYQGVRALCAANDVDASVELLGRALRLRLQGRQDALGVWSRHGRRVARTVVQVLGRCLDGGVEGQAAVALPRGRKAYLRLDVEACRLLGASGAAAGWPDDAGWSPVIAAELAMALRVRAEHARGWGVRRLPEPRAWASGVLVPDLLVQAPRGQRTLACLVRSSAHAAQVLPVAQGATSGEPYLFVGQAEAVRPLSAAGLPVASVEVVQPAALAEAVRAALLPGQAAPRPLVRAARAA